jgi:hypothetical protein
MPIYKAPLEQSNGALPFSNLRKQCWDFSVSGARIAF